MAMDVYLNGRKVELNHQIERYAESNPAKPGTPINKQWQCNAYQITGSVLIMHEAVSLRNGWPDMPYASNHIIISIPDDCYLVINEMKSEGER